MKNAEADRRISIWYPQEVEGRAAFVRPEPYPLGDHFADKKVLFKKKKSGVRRVCFFGESVAAGYGYAPHLTPARVLENQFRHFCGNYDFEIVDLSRTNETIGGMTTTVESAMQLNPDALVVFSGNNWTMLESPWISTYAPQKEKRVEFGQMFRESGIEGPIRKASLEVLQKAGSSYVRIEKLARAASIPVILVIPEINLADWENKQPAIWLPGDGNAQWYAMLQQAKGQLALKNWKAAEETALKMETLDGGTNPTTYRLLARAFIGQDAPQKALVACQAEVDANHYASLCFLGAPQLNSGGRMLQNRAAQHHGFYTVDLREIFKQHTGDVLPGRRMFLDYCHLTLEGIKVAMAAVAAELLVRTDHPKKGINWAALSKALPDPEISKEADAAAKLGMAMHTAHRQSTLDDAAKMPAYWLKEAMATSPGILHAMAEIAQCRFSGLPAVLSHGLRENSSSPYRITMQHGWKYNHLDAVLISSMESVAGTGFIQPECGFFNRIQEKEAGIDLLNPPLYLWDPVERFFPEVMDFKDLDSKVFYRAAWPETSFAIPGKPPGDVNIRITHRLPAIPVCKGNRQGYLTVKLNEINVETVTTGENWNTGVITIPAAFFNLSLNKLTLCWPPLPPCGDAALENIKNKLERGHQTDLHPVFGEVFSILLFHVNSRRSG